MKSGLRVALDEIRANCGAGELSLVDVSVAAEMRETIRAADEVRCLVHRLFQLHLRNRRVPQVNRTVVKL
jgi:hypothetical protein